MNLSCTTFEILRLMEACDNKFSPRSRMQKEGKVDRSDPESNPSWQECMRLLSSLSSVGYEDWINIGMALHTECGGHNYGRSAWILWSLGTNENAVEECTAKWKTFNRNEDGANFTVAYLRNAVKDFQEEVGETFKFGNEDACVDYFNARFGVITLKGKFRIIDKTLTTIVFMTRDDFCNMLEPYTCLVPKVVKGESQMTLAKAASIWLRSPRRRTYKEIVFAPNKQTPKHIFNTYVPPILPEIEEIDLAPVGHFQDLLMHLCGNEQSAYDYLLDWITAKTQNPGWKIPVAIVMASTAGSGKGILGQLMKTIFQQGYQRSTRPEWFIGGFNLHMLQCVFGFADEAFFAGDPRMDGHVKGMITDADTSYEIKGGASFTADSCSCYLFATNNLRAVRTALGSERRYLVCSPNDKRTREWYETITKSFGIELFADHEEGTVLGHHHIHHWLLSRSLPAGYKSRLQDAPTTSGLLEQQEHSMSSEDCFWDEVEFAIPEDAFTPPPDNVMGFDGNLGTVSLHVYDDLVLDLRGDLFHKVMGEACIRPTVLYAAYKAWYAASGGVASRMYTNRTFMIDARRRMGKTDWDGMKRRSKGQDWLMVDGLLRLRADWKRRVMLA